MAALLCLQNRTGGSPPMGGGFFNQHNGDFCISRDRGDACDFYFLGAIRMGGSVAVIPRVRHEIIVSMETPLSFRTGHLKRPMHKGFRAAGSAQLGNLRYRISEVSLLYENWRKNLALFALNATSLLCKPFKINPALSPNGLST